MPLFIALHQHAPETCPWAGESGSRILAHVSASHALRYGLAIQAEAVIDAEHRFLLIVEAAREEQVERFMEIFKEWGEVRIILACSSEEAAARGGCTAPPRP